MSILAMFFRSVVSYTVFLASRKFVRGSLGLGDQLKRMLKLYRCNSCYRLYSGKIEFCRLCGEETTCLYKEPYEYYQEEDKREGIDKAMYEGSRNLQFKPLKPRQLEMTHDRSANRTTAKPSGTYQRRSPRSSRRVRYN